MSPNEWECVLPSGRFARMRSIKLMDVLATDFGSNIPKLLSRIVTIDGETLPASEFEQMDLEEVAPLFTEMGARMARVNLKGVA